MPSIFPSTTIEAGYVLGAILGVIFTWAAYDFYSWVSFGTGGTSPDLEGYLKINKFRFLRALSSDRLDDASLLPADGPSYLESIPRRTGNPPYIMPRTLPQRQAPAPLDKAVYDRLHALPEKYVKLYPELLLLDKSATEGRSTDAIYARSGLPGRKKSAHDQMLGDELAHVHPAENSLHVWLTKADAKKVVEAGWGLRFPLASLGMVDEGWTFVYAPRSMSEVDVAEKVVKAAIGHLTGERV